MSLVLVDKSAFVRGLEVSVDDKFGLCAVTRLELLTAPDLARTKRASSRTWPFSRPAE